MINKIIVVTNELNSPKKSDNYKQNLLNLFKKLNLTTISNGSDFRLFCIINMFLPSVDSYKLYEQNN